MANRMSQWSAIGNLNALSAWLRVPALERQDSPRSLSEALTLPAQRGRRSLRSVCYDSQFPGALQNGAAGRGPSE